MATLAEFAKQQNQPQSNSSLSSFANQAQQVPTTSLSDFAKSQGVIAPKKTVTQKAGDVWNWIGKQLTKPSGVVATEFHGVGNAIADLLLIASPKISASQGVKMAANDLLNAQKGAWNVISGKEETNMLNEFKKAGIKPDALDKTMALGADLVLDPLNFFAPVKAVKKFGEVTKLSGPATKIASAIKEVPATKKLVSLFSNTTGNKEFDSVLIKFRNLRSFREGELLNQAIGMAKDIKVFEKTGVKDAKVLITEALENPASRTMIKDPKILNFVDSLQKTYKDLLNTAHKVGLNIAEIQDYAPRIRTKASFANELRQQFGIGAKEWSKGAVEKGRKAFVDMTQKEISELGGKYTDFFEKNPAVAFAKKGQMYVKAITSQEFAQSVKKFATETGQAVTHPSLKELKFAPEIAKVIDNYYKGIHPEEIGVILRTFDKIQNLWKAQALVSPAQHTRNVAGNIWNNYLAGVNPMYYAKAASLQAGKLVDPILLEDMKKLGVIDQGWYSADISEEVADSVKGIKQWKSLNPLSQENALFKLNKATGSVVENNARMAHYMHMIDIGKTSEQAAQSVKKFLFDYGDLTNVEKSVFKRGAPFYTWTRKNLPLQLQQLVAQPAKFALPHKIQNSLEEGVEQPNEKYMSDYLRTNIPIRLRKNKDGNTEYFLIGNWLPYASAIDILSHPIDTIVQMSTPLAKAPIEQWANQSAFWKDTLGRYQEIERDGMEYGEFFGQLMRKRNITLLQNIRILNDLNKWVDKNDKTAIKDSWGIKALNTFFGKAGTYDVEKAKYFYDRDTEDYIGDIKNSIKTAEKKGYPDKADDLRKELTKIIQERGQ